MLSIYQNVLYFVIAAFIVILLIAAIIKLKKTMKTDYEVKFHTNESKKTKVGDLESKCLKDEIVSPKIGHDEFNNMNENTGNSVHKREYSDDSNEHLSSQKAKNEHKKLSKLLIDIEEKETKLEKKNDENKDKKHE